MNILIVRALVDRLYNPSDVSIGRYTSCFWISDASSPVD
jgi:hypothetical protein